MPLLTSNRLNKKKTKPALSYPARVNTIALFCESSWWVSLCSIELQIQRARKGRGVKYVIVYGCRIMVSFFRVKNILTHHLLPLASLRSTRGNELSGIDCHVCAAMCSSPRHVSPGDKSHMSPAIYGLLLACSHIWISYHMSVSCALSWLDKGFNVCVSCVCVCV